MYTCQQSPSIYFKILHKSKARKCNITEASLEHEKSLGIFRFVTSTECRLQCSMSDARWQSVSYGASQQRRALSMLHVLSLLIARIIVEMITLKYRLNPQSDFLVKKEVCSNRWQNYAKLYNYKQTKIYRILHVTYSV